MGVVAGTRREARVTGGEGRSPLAALLALGLGIALAWGVAVGLARGGRNPILVYNGAFAVAFALYVVASALVVRRAAAGASGARALALILALALLPRAILLASDPALSDDLYRYIWDGKVAAAGLDPYRYAPDAPELAGLRDALWGPINQKAQHTPYPPAAQLVFALTYRVAPDSIKAQQVVATLADLLAIGALLLLLGRLGLPRERILLYAWSPTPALHFAHSAHNDALMIAPLLLALAVVVKRRAKGEGRVRGPLSHLSQPAPVRPSPFALRPSLRVVSGLALAIAALVKLVPLLIAPLLVWRWRLAGSVAFALGLLLGVAPFLDSGPAALTGLGTEAGEAVFNDSLHFLLVRLLAPFTARASTVAGAIGAAILAAAALALAPQERRVPRDDAAKGMTPVRGAAFLLGLALLLNAVVEPWYLAWMLPFVALFLRPGARLLPFAPAPMLGWLWLSGAVQLTDLTYLGPAAARWWPLIRLVEYGPLLALLVWAAIRPTLANRRAGRPGTAGRSTAGAVDS